MTIPKREEGVLRLFISFNATRRKPFDKFFLKLFFMELRKKQSWNK